MKKEDAKQLMAIYDTIGLALSDAVNILHNIEDKAELKRYLYPLGEVMADIWSKLQKPIVNNFPDLNPDKDVE